MNDPEVNSLNISGLSVDSNNVEDSNKDNEEQNKNSILLEAEELSVKLRNLAQEIFDELGTGYSESMYHEAFKIILQDNNIRYATEQVLPVCFRSRQIGFVRADLVIS